MDATLRFCSKATLLGVQGQTINSSFFISEKFGVSPKLNIHISHIPLATFFPYTCIHIYQVTKAKMM